MSKHSQKIGWAARTNHTRKPRAPGTPGRRRLAFEGLEQRQLLSAVGLNAISNITLPAGTSYMVALNGSDPSDKTVNFAVTTSNPQDVTPVVMPQSNPSLQFTINGLGTMTFQLLQNLAPNTVQWIENLVNADFYNGDYIYRAETGSFALIQGGNNLPTITNGKATGATTQVHTWPSTITSTTTDEEFNPDQNYTSAGALAMARSGANTSSSEFFVTDGATRSLDYAYTYFGFMTGDQTITYKGNSTTVLAALDSMTTTPYTSTSASGATSTIDYMTTPVEITKASIITDTQDGVLMLRAPTGVSGTFTVSVTAYDNGTNTPTTQTFTVTVAADAATGNTANPWASDTPKAPTAIAFQAPSGQTNSTFTSENNSSTGTELKFLVSNVTAGDEVTLYADGVAIGSGTVATGATTITVATNDSTTLLDGTHTFTATQTDLGVSVIDSGDNSLNESANVDSLDSPATQVQVITSLTVSTPPSASAKVGQRYTYAVQTNAPSGDTVTVNQSTWTLPSGMTYNATNETFTWTPSGAEVNTSPTFSASLTDSLGLTASIGPVEIAVSKGVAVTEIPVNATLGGDVTVKFIGNQVLVYNNIGQAALTYATFDATDSVEVDCPAGQANSVLVILPDNSSDPLPQQVVVQGLSGSTNNQVTVLSTHGGNTFDLAGGTITANGLQTEIGDVQKLTLAGQGGNDNYALTSSSMPTWVVDTGSGNTLDFSQDTGAVTVNLGLDKGQAQSIAPWNTTLMIYGEIDKLIGSNYADVLTGGPAATTEILAGSGNATITGGSGNNILVGGGGADTITGGAGNNLIIGGAGNSNLYAEGTGNTIFAGATNEDSNDQALLALLDQPSRVNYGYSARRLLASAYGNPSLLASPVVSFQDTGATDTIFGSSPNNWLVLGTNTSVKG